jgi:hypothetical protein
MDFTEATLKTFETRRLLITLLSKQSFDLPGLETYVRSTQKLNVLAVSEAHLILFIACQHQIHCHPLRPCPVSEPLVTLTVPVNQSSTEAPAVNNLKIGLYKESEVLIVVTMAAQVLLYFTADLTQSPIVFNNYRGAAEDNSTWSCDLRGSFVAVGSNANTISVWEVDTGQRTLLDEAHSHNIPSVEFSPSGRYIASTSIDSSVVISSCTGTVRRCLPSSEWGWSVKWVKSDSIDIVDSLPQSNISNLEGRYTSSLSTHYYNSYSDARGQFTALSFMNFLRGVSDRLEGIPAAEEDVELSTHSSYLTASHTQESDAEEELASYFVLQTSRSSVHLIDPSINPSTAENSMHVLSVFLPNLEITPHRFTRLSLVEYLPDLATVLIGNQGGSQLYLLRIVKAPRETAYVSKADRRWKNLYWVYSFIEESHFTFQSSLIAMTVGPYSSEGVRVYCLTENSTLHVLQVKPKRLSLANVSI